MNDADTTEALREALEALAGTVDATPTGYGDALRTWRRRERRRRLILTALIVLVFTMATVIGLLVLDHSTSHPLDQSGVASIAITRIQSTLCG
jgi:hypothetical protein